MPLSNSLFLLLSTPRHVYIRRTIRFSRFSNPPDPFSRIRTCHGLASRVYLEQEMVLDALLQRVYFALNLLGGAAMLLLLVTLAIPGRNPLFSRARIATLTSLCFSRLISVVFSCLLCVLLPSAVNLVSSTKLSSPQFVFRHGHRSTAFEFPLYYPSCPHCINKVTFTLVHHFHFRSLRAQSPLASSRTTY